MEIIKDESTIRIVLGLKLVWGFYMKIKFKTPTWVLKQAGGGFDSYYITKAVQIEPKEFEVIKIKNSGDYSTILVWTNGFYDGDSEYLINVPNSLFEIL